MTSVARKERLKRAARLSPRKPVSRWEVFFDSFGPHEYEAHEVICGDLRPDLRAFRLGRLTMVDYFDLVGRGMLAEGMVDHYEDHYPPPYPGGEAEVRAVADRIEAASEAELADSGLPVDDAFRARYPKAPEFCPSINGLPIDAVVSPAELAAHRAAYAAWCQARRPTPPPGGWPTGPAEEKG